jgi:type II secretion system F domain protein
VPELGDFADIMRLEEQGAALAETLQARVRELREGHLAKQRSRAQADTEALTIWMTLPALILGLAFIIPPLFILIGL